MRSVASCNVLRRAAYSPYEQPPCFILSQQPFFPLPQAKFKLAYMERLLAQSLAAIKAAPAAAVGRDPAAVAQAQAAAQNVRPGCLCKFSLERLNEFELHFLHAWAAM